MVRVGPHHPIPVLLFVCTCVKIVQSNYPRYGGLLSRGTLNRQ